LAKISEEREKALAPTVLNATRVAGVKAEVTANMVVAIKEVAFILGSRISCDDVQE
jgi:hypothetical protein